MISLIDYIPLALYGLLFAGLALGLARLALGLARHPRNRITHLLAFVFALISAFALLQVMKSQAPLNAHVSIKSPQNGATFHAPPVPVSGTVSPPNARVSVLVHPEDTDHWWIQSSPAVDRTTGQWHAVCYIGTDSMGIGRNFDIVAVGSASPWVLDALLGRSFIPGRIIKGLPLVSKSEIVVVHRVE